MPASVADMLVAALVRCAALSLFNLKKAPSTPAAWPVGLRRLAVSVVGAGGSSLAA